MPDLLACLRPGLLVDSRPTSQRQAAKLTSKLPFVCLFFNLLDTHSTNATAQVRLSTHQNIQLVRRWFFFCRAGFIMERGSERTNRGFKIYIDDGFP